MEDAGVWKDEYLKELIYDFCQTCKLYGKTLSRLVVSMPMVSKFKEKAAIYLKIWKGKYILHMVDVFDRLSVSVFIRRKTPTEVTENIQ